MTTERNIENVYKTIAVEKHSFLKNQLHYVNEALAWPQLESWERKEYEQLKVDYTERIKDQELHIETNF